MVRLNTAHQSDDFLDFFEFTGTVSQQVNFKHCLPLLHFFVSKLIAFDHRVISENDFGNSFSPFARNPQLTKERSYFRRSLIRINYPNFLILLFDSIELVN